MLHVHTIGRIGKDCQVITGTHGSFMAMNMAVDDYSKGQNVTTWVKVRSSKENHIRLAEYLTKGRLVLVEGTLSSSLWTDKTGRARFSFPLRRRTSHSSIPARRIARLAARTTWLPRRTAHPSPLPICRRTTRTTCRSDKSIPVTVWTGLWYMPYPAVRGIDPLPVWCMPVAVYIPDGNKNNIRYE